MKKSESCCSCAADFKKEVDGLVNEVEGYGKDDRDKREDEVKAAFDKDKDKTASEK